MVAAPWRYPFAAGGGDCDARSRGNAWTGRLICAPGGPVVNVKCLFGSHRWRGCKCDACGKTRDQQHDWSKDCEECSICGKMRTGAHAWAGCRCLTCQKRAWRGYTHVWRGNTCSVCSAPRPPCGYGCYIEASKKVHLSEMNALFLKQRRYLVMFDFVRPGVGPIRVIDILFENGMECRDVSIHQEIVLIPAIYAEEPVESISVPTADRQRANSPFSAQAADQSSRLYQPNSQAEFASEYGLRV